MFWDQAESGSAPEPGGINGSLRVFDLKMMWVLYWFSAWVRWQGKVWPSPVRWFSWSLWRSLGGPVARVWSGLGQFDSSSVGTGSGWVNGAWTSRISKSRFSPEDSAMTSRINQESLNLVGMFGCFFFNAAFILLGANYWSCLDLSDVLGHFFHSYVFKDLPESKRRKTFTDEHLCYRMGK